MHLNKMTTSMYIRFQNSCSYIIGKNHFEVRSDVFNKTFRFKGLPENSVEPLLKSLQDGVKEEKLFIDLAIRQHETKKKIKTIISFLKEKNFLIHTHDLFNTPPEDTPYDRQIRFFNSFETDIYSGKEFNKKLQNRKVVIVGLGAYGSWLALHVSRLGIKNIVGIDYDKVELSNLHRQLTYTKKDIGEKKSEACAKILMASDDTINYEGQCKKIESEADLLPFLYDADFVFNAFGYFPVNESEHMISGIITKACIETQTPMLCLSNNWLGPLYIPGISACYFCTVTNHDVELTLNNNKKNIRTEKRAFSPIIATTCSIAALEATQYLSGINRPSSIDGLRYIDPFNIESSKFIPIAKNPNCRFCSNDLEK